MSKAKKITGFKLTQEMIETISNFAIDKYKKTEQDAVKARFDKRLANTKLLLKNYRLLIDHCDNAVYETDNDDDDNYGLVDMLGYLSSSASDSLKIESICRSSERTRIIVSHIDKMINLYEYYCDSSPHLEEARRYRVIYWLYLDPESKTRDELAEEEHTDKRTIYRDINIAVECLTTLIFGIDGLSRLVK
ncbi:MAG: hypothetical protein FWB96_01315 [Defluviitaleaceae bacterium]|nr:hypothetical protein [Defluviitaleaceae bacterium]MCL2261668.1 hypothetical protein [Defluviitaleaceae bacterium]